jgi:predicted AAA+ superfamily ATPase
LFDTGVTNALNRRLTAVPDPAARGRLFEQWIVLECIRMLDYARTEARPYYWRTHMGAEVDLVVEKHGRLLLAAEIKSSARVSGGDLSGLRSFADAHPRVPLYVVSEVADEYRLAGVRVVPYRLFFQELRKRIGSRT